MTDPLSSDRRSKSRKRERLFTVAQLRTIIDHEAYTEREKKLARHVLLLRDHLMAFLEGEAR